jgi:flagellar biosynthesis protein FlhF
MRGGARGAYAIDAASEILARALTILPSPKRPKRFQRPPLFAFVGPAGVGKTTTLAKLGRRLRAGGRRVLFASLDPLSLAALERVGGLENDIDRGELPLELVRDAGDLERLLRRAGAIDTVLLDTPGFSPREETRLDEAARELARFAGPCELETLLVLSAASSRGALRTLVAAFAPFRARGAVLTKLDETDEPAAAYEALLRARLPLAFLCDGQDTRANLVRPSGEALAGLVLRGHLAGDAGA